MASWRQSFRYALRRFSRSPGFAAAAVVSIGLGIAANSTIFSIVSRFVLWPAPVGHPATLVSLSTTHDGEQCCNSFSWPLFADVRDQAKSFSGVASYYELVPASIGGAGDPERVWGQAATANFFDVAQLGMTLGRGFLPEEEHAPVVVLGYRLWQRRFHADPAIAGRSVSISGRPFTVVGVAPPAFRGLDLLLEPEFWVPLANLDQLLPNVANYRTRNYHWIQVAARLKPGATRAQAEAELQVLAGRLAQFYPATDARGGFHFEPAGSMPPRDKPAVLLFLATLSAVVLLVLAIACANVANLLLAQAAARRREMAVRLALGATRGRLLCQLLAESVLLALGGGGLGVALSLWATQALSAFRLPAPVPLDTAVSVDWRVLLYTFTLSVGCGLLSGFVPAWATSRPILANALKGGEGLARPGRRLTARHLLVISQMAMCLVLLCATGLFLRSLRNAAGIDIGFRSRDVLMLSVDPKLNGYTAERTTRFLAELRKRAAALPGVISAAATDVAPLSGGHRSDGFVVEGTSRTVGVDLYMITSGYFETLGIPRVAGRAIGDEDSAARTPKAAVVNEAFAQRIFGNAGAIGRLVRGGGVTYEVVGVVKNTKSRTLGEEARPVLYRSLAQSLGGDPSFLGYTLLARTAGDYSGVTSALRAEIRKLDPSLATFNAATMEEHLRDALFLPRLAGTLFAIFGGMGLVLAAVGLYGVISYSVSQRTREIGIRLALGAEAGAVQRLIVRQGMLLAAIAMALGLAGAWAAARFAASFLYGIRPHDAATFTAVPLFLAVVALAACWIPSRRAASVDPAIALRHE